jgi:hypothetical protein
MSVAIRPIIIGSSFTTPAGVTAYVSGDLIANSATAGLVNPLAFHLARGIWAPGYIRKARVKTPDTGAASASVRLHLYKFSPTPSNGDNGVWLTNESTWLGSLSGTLDKHFTDFEKGELVPDAGAEIYVDANQSTKDEHIYGLLEARGGITPQGAKAWDVTLLGFPGEA